MITEKTDLKQDICDVLYSMQPTAVHNTKYDEA